MAGEKIRFGVAVSKEMQRVKRFALQEMKIYVNEIYSAIYERSPVWTGWYKNNNRIRIGGGIVKVYPKKRPGAKRALVDNHAGTRKEELAKLKNLKAYSKVFIANGTDFVSEIESKHSVYGIGVVEGQKRAQSRIKNLKRNKK